MPPTTGTPVDVWVAYAIGIIGLLTLIIRAAPGVFGPIGRWVEAWTDRRQRVQRHTTAAEVQELQTSVRALQEQFAETRERAADHAKWDRNVYRELVRAGIDVEPPPPLF